MKFRHIGFALVLGLIAGASSVVAAQEKPEVRLITVTGEAEVKAPPDK